MESNFLDSIIKKDTELLIYLNNLGSKQWDSFWLFITNQFNWIPLFAIILGLIFTKFKLKKTAFILLFIIVLVAFSDQFTNLIKYLIGRTRPCNVPEIQEHLRQFEYRPGGKSFWSGHASLSATFTTFIVLLLRRHYKFIYLLVLFPVFFGCSRIYLRVHYPIDVFCGYLSGLVIGCFFFRALRFFFNRVFKQPLM